MHNCTGVRIAGSASDEQHVQYSFCGAPSLAGNTLKVRIFSMPSSESSSATSSSSSPPLACASCSSLSSLSSSSSSARRASSCDARAFAAADRFGESVRADGGRSASFRFRPSSLPAEYGMMGPATAAARLDLRSARLGQRLEWVITMLAPPSSSFLSLAASSRFFWEDISAFKVHKPRVTHLSI